MISFEGISINIKDSFNSGNQTCYPIIQFIIITIKTSICSNISGLKVMGYWYIIYL